MSLSLLPLLWCFFWILKKTEIFLLFPCLMICCSSCWSAFRGISRMSYPGNPVEFWNQLELAEAETISLRESGVGGCFFLLRRVIWRFLWRVGGHGQNMFFFLHFLLSLLICFVCGLIFFGRSLDGWRLVLFRRAAGRWCLRCFAWGVLGLWESTLVLWSQFYESQWCFGVRVLTVVTSSFCSLQRWLCPVFV